MCPGDRWEVNLGETLFFIGPSFLFAPRIYVPLHMIQWIKTLVRSLVHVIVG